MSEPGLQEGDLVRLIAGGPAMSLQVISEDGRDATCLWFDKDGVLMEQTFRVRSLERVVRDQNGASGS